MEKTDLKTNRVAEKLHFDVKVTATAPIHFKPRTMSVSGFGSTDKPNAKTHIEALAIERIEKNFEKAYPGIPFKFKATATRIGYQFFVVDCEEVKPEKKTKEKAGDAPIDGDNKS